MPGFSRHIYFDYDTSEASLNYSFANDKTLIVYTLPNRISNEQYIAYSMAEIDGGKRYVVKLSFELLRFSQLLSAFLQI